MVKSVKVGDKIFLEEETDTRKMTVDEWTVTAVYRHHVMVQRGSRRQCVPYGELIRQGLEIQNPEMEALKLEKGAIEREAYSKEAAQIKRCEFCKKFLPDKEGNCKTGKCLVGHHKGSKKLYKSTPACREFERNSKGGRE